MSGGYFDYKQFAMSMIADKIEHVMENNNVENEWGEARNLSEDILEKFKQTVKELRKLEIKVQLIDWLLSGDDGEDSFSKRWEKEIG